MKSAEVRRSDATMVEVRLAASKEPRLGPVARPKAGHDALPDTQHAICVAQDTGRRNHPLATNRNRVNIGTNHFRFLSIGLARDMFKLQPSGCE